MNLTVVYLIKSTGDMLRDMQYIKKFITAYHDQINIPSSVNCTLQVLIKPPYIYTVSAYLRYKACSVRYIADFGYDLGAYFDFAKDSNCDIILPMSMTSCFATNNSLSILVNEYINQSIESNFSNIIIASQFSTSSFKKKLMKSIQLLCQTQFSIFYLPKYLYTLLLFRLKYSSFPKFPNLHFRSTGFLISRLLYIEYFLQYKAYPSSKYDCHLIESGQSSLFRFLLSFDSLIVWKNSHHSYYFSADSLEKITLNSIDFFDELKYSLIHDHRSTTLLNITQDHAQYYRLLSFDQY